MNKKKSKSILIICPFPKNTAAGQRLKYEQYLNKWELMGYNIYISNFIDYSCWKITYKKGFLIKKIFGILRGYLRRIKDISKINKYDIVYIHMWVTPYGSTLFERVFTFLSKKVIFDLEDNLLVKNNFNKAAHPNPITFLLKNPNKQIFLIKNSDVVITSSPELEKICKRLNKNNLSFYITSSINTKKFVPRKNKENNEIIIGWTGTFSSKKYLNIVEDVLQELAREFKFKFHVIGNFEYFLPNIDLIVSKWSIEDEVKQMQTIDIGIYPLPKDEFVDGKSGLKAIQYMAFGIPTVASNVGNTPNIISNNIDGFLVNNKMEWRLALRELIKNKELREKMGNNARKKVLENYSLGIVSKSYAKVINLCTKK